mgnify:CR=1 FL=1
MAQHDHRLSTSRKGNPQALCLHWRNTMATKKRQAKKVKTEPKMDCAVRVVEKMFFRHINPIPRDWRRISRSL